GSFTTIDDPSASIPCFDGFPCGTTPQGISDSGETVGHFYRQDSPPPVAPVAHGFLYIGGSFTNIDFPAGVTGTFPVDINNSGQIVGLFQDGMGLLHSVLDTAGSFTPIDVPGNTCTSVSGINDNGQIVGSYLLGMGGSCTFSGG